jgi:hypothetical protein
VKLNKVNLMEHLILTIDLGQCEPLDQKGKPNCHLGILKEEKGKNEKSFFLGEIERLRESKRRRSFPFSEEGFAAKKRHDFQDKNWARISRQSAGDINPYGTDLVRLGFLYLFWTHNSTNFEANNNIYWSVQTIRPPYSSNIILGAVF